MAAMAALEMVAPTDAGGELIPFGAVYSIVAKAFECRRCTLLSWYCMANARAASIHLVFNVHRIHRQAQQHTLTHLLQARACCEIWTPKQMSISKLWKLIKLTQKADADAANKRIIFFYY